MTLVGILLEKLILICTPFEKFNSKNICLAIFHHIFYISQLAKQKNVKKSYLIIRIPRIFN